MQTVHPRANFDPSTRRGASPAGILQRCMRFVREMKATARTADVINVEQRRAREKSRCSQALADEHRIRQVRLSVLFLVV